MGELVTMAAPSTNTKRRTVHCSKHAFAPIASFHPKNAVAPRVTLPVQRHQTCLRRMGPASESLVTGDDPLNATDPLGLVKGNVQSSGDELSNAEKQILEESSNGTKFNSSGKKLTQAEMKLWRSAQKKLVNQQKIDEQARNKAKRGKNNAANVPSPLQQQVFNPFPLIPKVVTGGAAVAGALGGALYGAGSAISSGISDFCDSTPFCVP
jgi:hypothetical protein